MSPRYDAFVTTCSRNSLRWGHETCVGCTMPSFKKCWAPEWITRVVDSGGSKSQTTTRALMVRPRPRGREAESQTDISLRRRPCWGHVMELIWYEEPATRDGRTSSSRYSCCCGQRRAQVMRVTGDSPPGPTQYSSLGYWIMPMSSSCGNVVSRLVLLTGGVLL